jgi:pimeloyl-ACP methyl ester carboxylesterase
MTRSKLNAAKPMVIARSGYFYVHGGIDHTIPGAPYIGQMYVEFWIPQRLCCPYPVIMIHGNWQTGTNFTGTPDGREGWAQYFLRRGYAVYVVDQVARGRSPHWTMSHGSVGPPDLDRVAYRFVAPKRYNRWPQAKLHTQWPGTGEPGDPFFDQFYASQFPSIADNETSQRINRDSCVSLLDKLGPSIVLTHSQSGAYGWLIADARPKLVKALISIEPNGPPVYETALKGPPDWFEDIGPRKTYGLGFQPLTYDPPLLPGEQLQFVRQDKPDEPGLVRGWLQAEPARKLPNLAQVPILIVVGEASYHAAYDHCTAAYLRQAGVPVTFIHLAKDAGIRGNGHMMMLEKNSDEIAALLASWVEKTLASKSASKSAKTTAGKSTRRAAGRSRRRR